MQISGTMRNLMTWGKMKGTEMYFCATSGIFGGPGTQNMGNRRGFSLLVHSRIQTYFRLLMHIETGCAQKHNHNTVALN